MPLALTVMQKVVNLVNETFESKYIKTTPLLYPEQIRTTGTVLYPLSAGDVCGALQAFPFAKRYVMIDAHPFFDPDASTITDVVNIPYLKRFIAKPSIKDSQKLNIAAYAGMFGRGDRGYDISNLYDFYRHKSDIAYPKDTPQYMPGLSHLMLPRLRACCNMTLLSIESVPGETGRAIQIIKCIDGASQEKEIIFVEATLGKNSIGYQWLYAQNMQYDALLVKGFPYRRKNVHDESTQSMCAQILSLLARPHSMSACFKVLTDAPQSREEHCLLVKEQAVCENKELDYPYNELIEHWTQMGFGYHSVMRSYDRNQLDFENYGVKQNQALQASSTTSPILYTQFTQKEVVDLIMNPPTNKRYLVATS